MADFTSRMVALLGAMRRERNGAVADAMRYYGADYGLNYGVSLPTVRTLARACGRDHEFARYLYAQEVRELRLAALHIAEPERLTADEFAFWGGGICNSEVAEEAAFALLGRIDAFDELFRSWCNGGTLLEGYAAVMAAARREDSLNHIVTAAAWLRRVAASEDYRLMAGVDATYLIDDYYELLPLMGGNERFLFDFGKALADLGRPGDSNAMLRRCAQLSADPMFLVLMGNNYRAMGLPAEAERCYRLAFSVMPNRIYPLYRLMKLYEEQGRRADCLRMARRVAAFGVKVESEATREMKREAVELLSNK